MTKTTVVVTIDGFDPEYLDACEAPNLQELGRKGFLKIGKSMMPSVTNVNNVSLVTASYPEVHGISSNYRMIRETGEEIYMESGEYILAETMFQRATKIGKRSILVTSKDKLRTLLSDGATITVSSEQAPEWVVAGPNVGQPPHVYSLEVNGWSINAANFIMTQHEADLVYITTTDYAMHTYAPDAPESQQHITILDNAIGDLLETHPDTTFLLTADHGMSAKSRLIDLDDVLGAHGIRAVQVPIIKDRYVVHHSNLGGCMFIYMDPEHLNRTDEAMKILSETPGIDDVYSREDAVEKLNLYHERIGDIVVTADKATVFGPSELSRELGGEGKVPPGLRSHASAHEQDIPLIGYNGDFEGFEFSENRDIGRYVFERVLTD
ncbi:MAG: alkaline phosphatase family protein [SAR202 cluster bacterium]|jgi:phosphonoacetate hydrolase|nr:alkaline phosphatase family protein [SAR202 cluster bacterium]